mmetsp:Transcript_7821/g.35527  ORF Transcript_7821/g.35527 Transcript_7821/m.35527 type:complete len:249 (-) Transcript_7821:881-1627(-)
MCLSHKSFKLTILLCQRIFLVSFIGDDPRGGLRHGTGGVVQRLQSDFYNIRICRYVILMLSRQNVGTPEQISDKHDVGHRITDETNHAANQERCVIRVFGCAHNRRIALHDTILPTGWAKGISVANGRIYANVFSTIEGLQRVYDVADERDLENLHHKSDDAIDCLIIVGFSECEHDANADDKQNHEGGEQADNPVHGKTWVERALGIDETPRVEVDDVAQRLVYRSHGAGPRYCDAHHERLYLQKCD